MMKRGMFAMMAVASVLTLVACNPAETQTPTDAAGPTLVEGLTITNARVVLAPVSGNPSAVYFELSYNGAPGIALDSVTVEGAGMTMIHDTAEAKGTMKMVMAGPIVLSKNAPVIFAPGGLHVMAMEPSAALKAGGTANVTFTLSDGTTATIAAAVRAAGEER